MNWGYKITIVIILFIAGMAVMVSIAMKQKNEMIDDHYYVKELKHQGQIDAENNLNALAEKLTIIDVNNQLKVHLPLASIDSISQGTIIFLRSSDQSKDRNFPLNPNKEGNQWIEKNNFVKGQYTVRISWQSNRKPFYFEQSYFVN
jgi:hypothetical protein